MHLFTSNCRQTKSLPPRKNACMTGVPYTFFIAAATIKTPCCVVSQMETSSSYTFLNQTVNLVATFTHLPEERQLLWRIFKTTSTITGKTEMHNFSIAT
ncbi:uncharacterized protein LOC122963477 isoform X1 [Acropora millepora]|uniref:uncharacterized protein LOC122963477 isoform X1 n=1 Tax=Acropora millepora TaxID=45264 RepID=UPI001CF3BBEA|nr:uncharacterized protein LOC122963477 isoform X1 [Acropora millepora]